MHIVVRTMPVIKKIRKTEKKIKPGKTVIKFEEEEPQQKQEEQIDDTPTGGVEIAAKTRAGLSKEWKKNEFIKRGDDTITGTDGQTYGSEKEFLEDHARLHGKKE